MQTSDRNSATSQVSGNATKGQPSKDLKSRRKIMLSQKDLPNYEAKKDDYRRRLDNAWQCFASDLQEVQQDINTERRQAATIHILEEYGRYQAPSDRYLAYLLGVKAEQSHLKVADQKTMVCARVLAVQNALMDTGGTLEHVAKPLNS